MKFFWMKWQISSFKCLYLAMNGYQALKVAGTFTWY